jgi:hypothetical protein
MAKMTMEKLCKQGKTRSRTRAFLREAARTGLLLLALSGPANNTAKAEETAKPTAPPAPEVGHYPDFSGAGVHGNPAAWSEYGNWGYAELSGSPRQENTSLSAILSSKLARDVQGLLKLNDSGDSHATTANVQGILALSLPCTLRAGIGIGVDSHDKPSAQAGIASVVASGRLLLRNGIDYVLPTGQVHAASEVRRSFGSLELTGSGSAFVIVKEGQMEYAGQAVGAGLHFGRHLFAFGASGTRIWEWDKFRLHYRLWATGDTLMDLDIRGKGEGVFRNPDYIGVGITRMF